MTEWIGVVLGLIGTMLGAVDLLLILQDRRQRLSIERLPGRQIQFRVTNHSLRPIPIQSVTMFYKAQNGETAVDRSANVRLSGSAVPGPLSPESSVLVEWSTETLLSAILSVTFYVEVETQTGKKVRSREFSQQGG